MTAVLPHLWIAFAVLADPWLSYVWYQRARKRIEAGVPNARVQLYRETIGAQVISAGLILAYWRSARIPVVSLGLGAPRSWSWTMTALLVMVGALAWSSLRLRPKAEKIRQRLQGQVGALLPDSHSERSWWVAVSAVAGLNEELGYRGFLLFYLSVYAPQTNLLERVLLSSLLFGLAHIYQGWKGAVSASILGVVFAGLYLITGSLLLPMVIHAALDSRILLMFPPGASRAIAAESHA
jgi:membrane protease YdiL (CAAX protease family)